ncbi:MAG: bifunctional oligoribonuclease/PAP phosphatase NrnA [Cytophagales bacterium]|nr:bifunctional oligoribonuclease/PAP phosphatase NrnA [Armatimonadota bacterium]
MVPILEREQMAVAVAALRAADQIVLASHINPDGDTLGSMLALGWGLRSLGKSVTLLSADGVPATLGFLPGAEAVQTRTDRRDFDLAVVLDAGDLERIGVSQEAVRSAPTLIDIDHHVTAGQFGQIRLLDSTAAATAEIVYDVLLSLGVSPDLPIAVNLLCALLTDTGSFRYRNVTPRTMALGGEMIRLGASPDSIAECVFENKPFAAQKLLGRALESLQRTPDGRIVWAHVTQRDFADFDATDEMTEGVVGAVRAVQGSDVALFLREMPTGRLRVSLRSRDPIDVTQVAAEFGGGGHRLASGCTLDGPLAAAEALLVAAVERHIAGVPAAAVPACAA